MQLMRVLLTLPLLGGLIFSLYGFTTTFEPMGAKEQITWRLTYGAATVTSVVLLTLLLVANIRADNRERPDLAPARKSREPVH